MVKDLGDVIKSLYIYWKRQVAIVWKWSAEPRWNNSISRPISKPPASPPPFFFAWACFEIFTFFCSCHYLRSLRAILQAAVHPMAVHGFRERSISCYTQCDCMDVFVFAFGDVCLVGPICPKCCLHFVMLQGCWVSFRSAIWLIFSTFQRVCVRPCMHL